MLCDMRMMEMMMLMTTMVMTIMMAMVGMTMMVMMMMRMNMMMMVMMMMVMMMMCGCTGGLTAVAAGMGGRALKGGRGAVGFWGHGERGMDGAKACDDQTLNMCNTGEGHGR